jgi:hypothetical protein
LWWLPKEGQASVTIPIYKWERVQKHFKEHKAELRKRGIKSPSALLIYWVEERLIEEERRSARGIDQTS